MSSNITTLYVSDTSIRLMVTRGKRIIKLAEVPLDADLADMSTEEKEAQITSKIKYLFKSNKIGARKIALGLSGLHCLTRPVVLPELPRAMLEEAVYREARRVLPVPVEQLYISWQTVAVSAGKLQAFMVAIPRQTADSLLKILNQAGYKPYLMEIKPLSLARLAKENSAIIVDVQPGEFDIVIMVGGLPQPIRTVPFPEEATSFADRVAVVKSELKRTIEFYNTNNPGRQIQPGAAVLVSGELAEEPSLFESLSKELGFKVEALTSPLKCQKQLDPSHHLMNVGLALKEMPRDAGPLLPNFNALPAPYQPKQVSLNRLMAIPATAVAVGLIVVLGMTIQDAAAKINTSQQELDANTLLLEKRQAQKKSLTESIANMEKQVAAAEAARVGFVTAFNQISKSGDKMNNDLQAVVNNVPPDLTVDAIGHSGHTMSIAGTAITEEQVFTYVRRLTATGRFKEITISNVRLSEPNKENSLTSYSLAVSLKEDVY